MTKNNKTFNVCYLREYLEGNNSWWIIYELYG